jgi:hypothetical protein
MSMMHLGGMISCAFPVEGRSLGADLGHLTAVRGRLGRGLSWLDRRLLVLTLGFGVRQTRQSQHG